MRTIAWRLPFALLAAAAGWLFVTRAILTVHHAENPVYNLPPVAVTTVLWAAACGLIAAIALPLVPRPRVAVLGGAVAFFLGLGIVALASVGILFLLAGAGLCILLVRVAQDTRPVQVVPSILSGTVLSLAVGVVLLVSSQPRMVTCFSAGGSGVATRYWWGGGASSETSKMWSSPDGTGGGWFTVDGNTYRYRCQSGQLVEFRQSK